VEATVQVGSKEAIQMNKDNRPLSVRLAEAKQSAHYWRDLSDCDCDSELPTGGCRYCDLDNIMVVLDELEAKLTTIKSTCSHYLREGGSMEGLAKAILNRGSE
jgi:hypothetical protein